MKKLVSFKISNLRNLEVVQIARDSINDVTQTNVSLLTSDTALTNYLSVLKEQADTMEAAIRNPQKNPLTQQLVEKDKARNQALRRFARKLAYYEVSDIETELKAFDSLDALWRVHRNASKLNYRAQTAATDNLLTDLTKEPYISALTVIDLQAEIDAVRTTNDAFRTITSEKRAGLVEKNAISAKDLRVTLSKNFSAFNQYVLAMAMAYDNNAEWEKVLKAINVVRQRYVNLLTRRLSSTKTETLETTKETKTIELASE